MPMGKYENFDACLKEHSKAYCGELYWRTHGKKKGSKKLKHEVNIIKELIKRALNNDR